MEEPLMLWQQMENAARLAIRKSPFAPRLREILRKKPLAKAHEIGLASGWDQAAQWLLSETGVPALAEAGFHSALRRDINTDIPTEFLLTALRKRLLLGSHEWLNRPAVHETLCTLMRQCINNEYVWFVSGEEQKAVAERLAALHATGDAHANHWSDIALPALYVRLEKLFPGAGPKKEALSHVEKMPQSLRELFTTYLSDHDEENSLKQTIESFGEISRSTSKMIAENYEEYPYPRWVQLELPAPESRFERLRQFFAGEEIGFLRQPFQVLVAGCGTGSKAIHYAFGYGERAQILAMDLSRASLAYASRMARKYGAKNIRFLQMDLLDLPKLGKRFDIIECTGVLHHLKDPLEGGRALVESARDGGIVHISLYSELARREIVKLRHDYEQHLSGVDNDRIREYRRRLMRESPDLIDERLSLRWDFFDLNRCKDLLFHPLEHRFTVPQIGAFLETLGLEFRGFERPDLIESQYWTPYPPRREQRDLSRWHRFERDNPDAFWNLYEIWSRKPAGH